MNYYKDTTYFLELALIDLNGNLQSGESITYKVFKSFDNTLFLSGSLTEIGITGIYKDSVIFTEAIQYRIEYTTPTKFSNVIETILIEEFSISTIHELITRTLGLAQENFRIFNPSYSGNNLISATVKIYPSASDVDADTNAIATYSITATYDGNNNVSSYKYKKV